MASQQRKIFDKNLNKADARDNISTGSCELIPHVQGKRNPSKMVGVAREHQRADTLKP